MIFSLSFSWLISLPLACTTTSNWPATFKLEVTTVFSKLVSSLCGRMSGTRRVVGGWSASRRRRTNRSMKCGWKVYVFLLLTPCLDTLFFFILIHYFFYFDTLYFLSWYIIFSILIHYFSSWFPSLDTSCFLLSSCAWLVKLLMSSMTKSVELSSTFVHVSTRSPSGPRTTRTQKPSPGSGRSSKAGLATLDKSRTKLTKTLRTKLDPMPNTSWPSRSLCRSSVGFGVCN